jgi:hypothetical protein
MAIATDHYYALLRILVRAHVYSNPYPDKDTGGSQTETMTFVYEVYGVRDLQPNNTLELPQSQYIQTEESNAQFTPLYHL